MPRLAEPHFEEERNQWYIYVQYRKRYLCSGRGNWAKAARMAEKLLGRPLDSGPALTVAKAIEQWCRHNGGAWEKDRLVRFNAYAGGVALDEVEVDLLKNYLQHLADTGYSRTYQKRGQDPRTRHFRYAAKTLRTMVSLSHVVLKWAADSPRRWLSEVPKLPDLPEPRKGHRDVPRGKLVEVFEDLPKLASPLLRFILHTGCRPEEACLLRWDQIDSYRCQAILEEHKTGDSTGEDRILYLSPHAMGIIDGQKRGGTYVFLNRFGRPYKPNGIRSILKRRGVTGGYALRHTYAQFARESGVPIDVLQKHLGHKHLSTTQIYAQIRDLQAAQAARDLPSPLQVQPLAGSVLEKAAESKSERPSKRRSSPRKRDKARGNQTAARRGASRRRSA